MCVRTSIVLYKKRYKKRSNLVVVFSTTTADDYKRTLCFNHAIEYAAKGHKILAETDDGWNVKYHSTESYCDECREIKEAKTVDINNNTERLK